MSCLKKHPSTPFETFQNTLPIEKTFRFSFTRLWNFLASKKYTFYDFSKILEFDLPLNQPVLTKIFQIDPKLTFNVFHILNHDHISKIEKNIWWNKPPSKKDLFGGGSVPSYIFFNFGDTTLIQNMKNIKSKFLIDL